LQVGVGVGGWGFRGQGGCTRSLTALDGADEVQLSGPLPYKSYLCPCRVKASFAPFPCDSTWPERTRYMQSGLAPTTVMTTPGMRYTHLSCPQISRCAVPAFRSAALGGHASSDAATTIRAFFRALCGSFRNSRHVTGLFWRTTWLFSGIHSF